ncbi:MAG: glycosyltransferase family 4 protein [Clostridia bacterium]|nr:glycosyltransferase family 4 protein [Clostridia bacterium]
MKVGIISNTTSDIIRSRGELIKSIIQSGHEVIAIGNEDVGRKKIEQLGAKFRNIKMDNISTNIFKNIKYIKTLKNVLKEENVDVILTYTIKPIALGAIAGTLAKVEKKYALVVGMGYNYSTNTFRTKIIRFFCDLGYKISGKVYNKMIFQNKEDMEEFIERKIVKTGNAVLIDGSGVDMKKFVKSENKIDSMDELKFLMISRCLNVKGIKELSLAAEKVKKKYPKVQFVHLGNADKTYRGITDKEMRKYSKVINFKGKVENVYEYIRDSNVVILPSYLREGIPRGLLEGLAVGRPIITTDIRGCRETVIEGKNGYLVKVKDENDLMEKIIMMINNTKEELQKMSEVSYNYAKERFDVEIINKNMLKYMELV